MIPPTRETPAPLPCVTSGSTNRKDAQHRVDGGYCRMISYLASECKARGGEIFLNAVVKDINWEAGEVTVTTDDGTTYKASQITNCDAIGRTESQERASWARSALVRRFPHIAKLCSKWVSGGSSRYCLSLANHFGWITKRNTSPAAISRKWSSCFSDEEIPTWWTQVPDKSNVLTGWLGGPAAADKATAI
jgi:hypothetical protein